MHLQRARKTGEKHDDKNEVSMGSTKPDIVRQSPAPQAEEENLLQKQELPPMLLSSLQSGDFSGRKADPVTIIYRYANIFPSCLLLVQHRPHVSPSQGKKSYQQYQGRPRLIWFHIDKKSTQAISFKINIKVVSHL